MPYSPSTWVDNSSPYVDAANLNNIESGISKAPYVPDASANQVPVWNGSAWVYQLVADANISATAAIAISKLASYPNDSTKFLRGDGTWQTVSSSSQLDYAAITSSTAAINATTEGTSVAVITGNSVSYDGTNVKVEFFVPKITATAGDPTLVFYRDSTVIGQAFLYHSTGAQSIGAMTLATIDTPPAGAHTYKVSAFVSANSVTFNAGTGGSGNLLPAFLRVSKA